MFVKKENLKTIQDYEVGAKEFVNDLKTEIFNYPNINYKLISKVT